MPPPRPKLHKKTGKLNSIKPVARETKSAETSSTDSRSRDSVVDRQFEVELYWCIQHLETSLSSGKLNQKQTLDAEKTLRILKSGNQPLIKKRQVMRSTFGDYRVQMAEEERKMSLAARQIKFADKVPCTKSHFVKKAALLSSDKDCPLENIKHLNISEDKILHAEENQNERRTAFLIVPSGNTFKFNFDIETEENK